MSVCMANDSDVPWSRSQPNARKKIDRLWLTSLSKLSQKKLLHPPKSIKAQEKIVETSSAVQNTPIIDQKCVLLKLCCYTWESMEIFPPSCCNHFRQQGINLMKECFEFFLISWEGKLLRTDIGACAFEARQGWRAAKLFSSKRK